MPILTQVPIIKLISVISAVFVTWFAATHLLAGHVFPNVWALGISIGNMPIEMAQEKLLEVWDNQVQIQLVDGDRVWTASPTELGFDLDTKATAEHARNVGMAGVPLGYNIEPVVNVNAVVAQSYLTSLAAQVNTPPVNANFKWQDDQLIAVAGQSGHQLDIDRILAIISQSATEIVIRQELSLITRPVPPDVTDGTPYIENARQLVSQPFALTGYDPFRDESITWTTTREASASWLEVGKNGLDLREVAFTPFLQAQNANLHEAEADRYLDPTETIQALRQAVTHQENTVALRIRYHPISYTVVAGDTGYRIARKTGIPFYLIQEANPGFDLSVLSPGDTLQLPSRDVTVPLPPVKNKRIVIDLETQNLVAYENGQQVFSWLISSGIDQAPTSPGVFQVLSHEPVAYGSSYTLCGDTGCGQWEMQWFMGIYEVTPGLVNGFHGAVLLPNGAYLGGGNVGSPYTLGCIMSQNDNAEKLYKWADEGTIVEIVSSEFQPQSGLGRTAISRQ